MQKPGKFFRSMEIARNANYSQMRKSAEILNRPIQKSGIAQSADK